MSLHPKTGGAVLAALALTLGLAACGDDDDDTAADGGDAPAELAADEAADEAGGDTAAYCDAHLALESAPPPDIDFATATPDEITEGVRTYAADVMRPLAEEVLATAPDELSDDFAVLDAALDQMAASGDPSAFDAPEATEAERRIHAHDLEACEWATVDVTAADYAFDGLPDELTAGVTSFELANEGQEAHELLLLRKNDGVTQSAEELLALPEEEAMELVTMVGDPPSAPPGADDYAIVDLEPGDYVAACFVPTGATGEDGPPPAGPPHAAHGMVAEFRVA
ncbi:MAG TPA: hypothetical protein VIL48_06935 [Acidimicrobiales bacterium]